MAAKKLDMTEPYGEVMGDASGCRYVQNGNQYDAQGKYLRKDGDAAAPTEDEPSTETQEPATTEAEE